MRFPDSVLAESAKGKEVRNLISRGGYVLHEYLDPETMKPLGKKKLYLKDDKGFSEAFFVIPLKGERSLLIKARETEEGRRIWNPTTEKTEDLWGWMWYSTDPHGRQH